MNWNELNHAQQELILWVENTEAFYSPAVDTIEKFCKRGDFNLDTAIKWLSSGILRTAAKDYTMSQCSMTQSPWDLFPLSERKEAAEYLARSIREEYLVQNSEAVVA